RGTTTRWRSAALLAGALPLQLLGRPHQLLGGVARTLRLRLAPVELLDPLLGRLAGRDGVAPGALGPLVGLARRGRRGVLGHRRRAGRGTSRDAIEERLEREAQVWAEVVVGRRLLRCAEVGAGGDERGQVREARRGGDLSDRRDRGAGVAGD